MSNEELIESTFKEVLKKKRMTILGFPSRAASRELEALQLDSEKYTDSYKATLYGDKKGWRGIRKTDTNAVALNIISDNSTMFAPLLSNAQ